MRFDQSDVSRRVSEWMEKFFKEGGLNTASADDMMELVALRNRIVADLTPVELRGQLDIMELALDRFNGKMSPLTPMSFIQFTSKIDGESRLGEIIGSVIRAKSVGRQEAIDLLFPVQTVDDVKFTSEALKVLMELQDLYIHEGKPATPPPVN